MHWKYVYFHHLKSENEALSQSWWCTLWDDSRSLHPSLQCRVGDLPTGPHLSLPLLAWSHLLKCGWMDVELRSCFLQLPSPLQSYAAPSFRIKVNLIRMHWNMLTVCVWHIIHRIIICINLVGLPLGFRLAVKFCTVTHDHDNDHEVWLVIPWLLLWQVNICSFQRRVSKNDLMVCCEIWFVIHILLRMIC